MVQIGPNWKKHGKGSHRKHRNTQKFFCAEKDVAFFHGDTQKFFCAVGDFLSHTEITEDLKCGKTKAQRSQGRVDCLG